MLSETEKNRILFAFANDARDCWFDDIRIDYENEMEDENYYWTTLRNLTDMSWGCTKLCLFFSDIPDYVVKIPISQIQDSDSKEWWDFCKADSSFKNVEEDIIFTLENQGAESSNWDYCFGEAALSIAAERNDVSDLVCGTEFIGFDKGLPIYVSKRMHRYLEDSDEDFHSTEEGREEVRKTLNDSHAIGCGMYTSIGEEIVLQYGKSMFRKLCDFIAKYHISDLHEHNFMCDSDNMIKLIDLAGLYD